MTRPPSDRRDRPDWREPTWEGILVSFAAIAAVPLLLWVASRPVVGALTLVAGAGLLVGVRDAYRLVRCVRECRALSVDLGHRVNITITERCVCAELTA